MRYEIENGAVRDFAFRTTGGLVIVRRGERETVEIDPPMTDDRIADLARKGVRVREAEGPAEAVSAPVAASAEPGAEIPAKAEKPATPKRSRRRKAKT